MKKKIAVLLLGIVTLVVSAMAGSKNPIVGWQEMYPTKDIIDNAVNSADHTTLVEAVKAAGLVDTLKSAGPFTVFAPTNEAFAKLTAGTVENLLKPENKDALTKVLTYHVVAGRLRALDLKKQIKAGNRKAMLKTVSGGTLVVMMQGENIVLKDKKGGVSTITIPNVFQSNGVIHVVDTNPPSGLDLCPAGRPQPIEAAVDYRKVRRPWEGRQCPSPWNWLVWQDRRAGT
jgi:uncharacterized surface protein with fasciclin (FAS1) repeats